MKTLEEKVLELEKNLTQKTDQDVLNEFDRAKREVKEEASKREKVNIDLLHEKLIVLERLSRKNDKICQEKISLILSRFHTHKSKPSFAAALVLKLICSKEEEIILVKEQKLLNNFCSKAQENTISNTGTQNSHSLSQLDISPANSVFNMPMNVPPQFGFMNNMQPFPQFPFPMPPFNMLPQPRNNTPRRKRFRSSVPVCFKCQKVGHIMKDCQQN